MNCTNFDCIFIHIFVYYSISRPYWFFPSLFSFCHFSFDKFPYLPFLPSIPPILVALLFSKHFNWTKTTKAPGAVEGARGSVYTGYPLTFYIFSFLLLHRNYIKRRPPQGAASLYKLQINSSSACGGTGSWCRPASGPGCPGSCRCPQPRRRWHPRPRGSRYRCGTR